MIAFYYLLSNEMMKIFKRPGAWVFITILFLLNVFLGLFVKQVFSVTGDMPFWEYMNLSSRLLIAIQLITIVYAGDILSGEYTKGTIKLLLLRPFNRSKILFSKLMTILILIAIFTILQFVFSFLTSMVFFFDGMTLIDSTAHEAISYYFFMFIEIIIVSIIAFMLSVVTKSGIFSITFTIFIFYVSSILVALFEHYNIEKAKYILFANTNLQQYYYGEPMFSGMNLPFSIMIIIVHVALFLFISFGLFQKRDVHV